MGLMQKKIQKYEARMDEAATVAAQLVQSKTLVQSLQEKIDNNDNEIRLQALQVAPYPQHFANNGHRALF